jgi:FtsP/CotA-like multicopper oxidase with cupredoxin domain
LPAAGSGSVVSPPPELFSVNGVLNLQLNYLTTVDSARRTLFCLNTPNGLQGPTLHVMPGDTLNVTVTNLVPAPPAWISDGGRVESIQQV